MRFHKFDERKSAVDLIKSAAIESTNQLLARNGMTPIDLAKESIKRKEETRMLRAKND
jgi:hypothetical protein